MSQSEDYVDLKELRLQKLVRQSRTVDLDERLAASFRLCVSVPECVKVDARIIVGISRFRAKAGCHHFAVIRAA
jgi:hypothetical protein